MMQLQCQKTYTYACGTVHVLLLITKQVASYNFILQFC